MFSMEGEEEAQVNGKVIQSGNWKESTKDLTQALVTYAGLTGAKSLVHCIKSCDGKSHFQKLTR